MSFLETPTRTFPSNSALAEGLRVKLSAGYLVVAGATDVELGTMDRSTLSTDKTGTVRLRTASGTAHFLAADAITAGNAFYAAGGGKVSANGTLLCGTALQASTANNDLIEGLRGPNTDVTVRDAVLEVTPDDAEGAGNSIGGAYHAVTVATVTNDADDFIVLPPIADVEVGHQIVIACTAGGNFELRTPASSGTTINGQDCDGTKEYLCTDTDTIVITKATATGWIGVSYTSAGAVRTAVVPD